MKKKRRYIIAAVLLIIVILAVLCILIFFHSKRIEDAGGKIHIPRNIQLKEGETVNIVLPKFIVGSSTFSRETVYDLVIDIRENMEQEDVYANEDGTITEVLTQEQLEYRIQMAENSIIDTTDKYNDVRITINNKSFNSVQYYVSENCTFFEMAAVLLSIRCNLVLAQVYSGIPHDKWKINEKIIYEDGNIVMFEFYLQEGGSWDISTSEWNAKMQELSEK